MLRRGRWTQEHVRESGHFDRLGKISFSCILEISSLPKCPLDLEAEKDGFGRLCPSPSVCVRENLNLKDVTYRQFAENLEIH